VEVSGALTVWQQLVEKAGQLLPARRRFRSRYLGLLLRQAAAQLLKFIDVHKIR
jgi:hypothetical protein